MSDERWAAVTRWLFRVLNAIFWIAIAVAFAYGAWYLWGG